MTWHWHSPEPIANYLVENTIGAYDLSARTSPTSGVQYWEAQASTITAARKATNKIAMDNQEDIANFQQNFNGPWPFTTDGVVVGIAVGELRGGDADQDHLRRRHDRRRDGTSLGTFNHENMHQWFGDNVAEARVQPDVLEGGLRDARRVPQHRARGDASAACTGGAARSRRA